MTKTSTKKAISFEHLKIRKFGFVSSFGFRASDLRDTALAKRVPILQGNIAL